MVRGDFLKFALPFPDRTFEFVRMANLGLCIPLLKWEGVLKEAARVLAPGGRLELVDDQTFFPYGDAPLEEATEVEVDMDTGLLSPTPTAHPTLSPSTPTPAPRPPPPTPDPESSAFFDSSDDEEDDIVPPSSDSDPATDSASEHSSSDFTDAASTLVGSERGSLELKKLSMTLAGAPQLDFEPVHIGRPFSGVEHLVISIPPPNPPAVIDVTVDDGEMPPTPVPVRPLPPIPVAQSRSLPTPTPTSADSTSTLHPRFSAPVPALVISTTNSPPTSSSAPTTPHPTSASASASASAPVSRPASRPASHSSTSASSASFHSAASHSTSTSSTSTSSTSESEPDSEYDEQSAFDPLATLAPETSSGPWSTQRAAARDMERVFERMLATRYGLHTRPADLLVPVLARVFCGAGQGAGKEEKKEKRGRVERPASMHLKLAPVGVEERAGVVVVRDAASARGADGDLGEFGVSMRERGESTSGRDGKSVRAWMNSVEHEGGKEGTRRSKGQKPKLRLQEPAIPQGVSAKAAERLGIAVSSAGVAQTVRRPPTTLFESPEGSEEEDEEDGETSDPEESPVSSGSTSANGSSTRLPLGRGSSTWVAPDEWAAPPSVPGLSRENSESGGWVPTLSHAASNRTITAASSSRTITAASSTKTIKQLGIHPVPTLPPLSPSTSTSHSISNPPTPTLLTHTRGGSNVSTTSATSAASAISTASSGAYSESDPGPLRFSTGRVQHPGLILWPATFLPLGAQELEMHATKHVQTLLGCKPALAEYVAGFVDPATGERVVSEEEFEDAVWGYEWLVSFRFLIPKPCLFDTRC